MAQAVATKSLAAANSVVGPIEVSGGVVSAGVQYGAGGGGTVILEGTINDVDYVAIGLTPAAGGAVVASLTAAGIGTADVSAYSKVQARKSVAGTAGLVSLSIG